jgi:hypothetical protein
MAAVHRVLSATGRLSWFEVHDTIEEAMTGAGGRQPTAPGEPSAAQTGPAAGSAQVTGDDMAVIEADGTAPPEATRRPQNTPLDACGGLIPAGGHQCRGGVM